MPETLLKDIDRRMEGALSAFHNDLKGLRTGRDTALLDNIVVEVYGSKMPLNKSLPSAFLSHALSGASLG